MLKDLCTRCVSVDFLATLAVLWRFELTISCIHLFSECFTVCCARTWCCALGGSAASFWLRGCPVPCRFNDLRSFDKLTEVQEKVKEITHTMEGVIEATLDRGDRVDDLDERSRALVTAATEFDHGARALKSTMMWQNIRTTVAITVIVLLVLVLIVLVISS